jgi:hypothetical protein
VTCLLCEGRGEIELLLTGETVPCPSCSPMSAAYRIAEHRGDLDYLAPAVSASGERPPPAQPSPGVLTGAEIETESARIQLMIANHRFKRAHGGSQ